MGTPLRFVQTCPERSQRDDNAYADYFLKVNKSALLKTDVPQAMLDTIQTEQGGRNRTIIPSLLLLELGPDRALPERPFPQPDSR